MHPPAYEPFSRLERLVLDAGYDIANGSFDEQCDRIRQPQRGL